MLLFMTAGGQAGLTFILPFLMFVFLLALGEDYNILVMTRIREEARGLGLREAVTRSLSMTGSTITSAGLVLAETFGVLALAGAQAGPNGTTFVDVGVEPAVARSVFQGLDDARGIVVGSLDEHRAGPCALRPRSP